MTRDRDLSFRLPLALLAGLFSIAAGAAQPPNILLILADDLGYSDLASYGGEIATPSLDRLADEGVRLTHFYSTPACSPTRSMLLSGTDSHLVGLGTMAEVLPFSPGLQGRPGYEGYLNPRAQSLAQRLRERGYATYMAGKWHLGKAQGQGPDAWGFERSFSLLDGGASHFQPIAGSKVRVENVSYREDGKAVQVPEDFYSNTFYTDKLIGYLEAGRATGKPFFAYAAYTAPHWPLQVPDEYLEKYRGRYDAGFDAIRAERISRQERLDLFPQAFPPAPPAAVPAKGWTELGEQERVVEARKMEVYAAMVEHLDMSIGRLLAYLKESGQYDNTLILFLSDNGAAGEDHAKGYSPSDAGTDNTLANLGRRGSNFSYGYRWAEVSSTPLGLVKGTSAEGGIAVPAIIHLPASVPGPRGQVLDGFGRVDDLAPTVLALAGVDAARTPSGKLPMSGRSLLPMLTGQSRGRSAQVAGELFGQPYVRDGDWKLVSAEAPDGLPPRLQQPYRWKLFNLADDRGETRDLAASHPERVAAMKAAWARYARWAGVAEPPAGP